jgi:hypothetical protein
MERAIKVVERPGPLLDLMAVEKRERAALAATADPDRRMRHALALSDLQHAKARLRGEHRLADARRPQVMPGHGQKITRKVEAAIAALPSQPTLDAAAAACRIGEVTLDRWLQLPEFQSAYQAARRQVLESGLVALQNDANDARAALRRNLTSGQPATEIRAADIILSQAVKGAEFLDVQQRLDELERALLPDRKGGRGGES